MDKYTATSRPFGTVFARIIAKMPAPAEYPVLNAYFLEKTSKNPEI
jgi:hypothetical protein